jgi:hypothetical protein
VLTSLTDSPLRPLRTDSACMWARCKPSSGTLPPTRISISSSGPRSPDERLRPNGRHSASAPSNSGAKAEAWDNSAFNSVRRDTPSLNPTWRPLCEAKGFYRCGGEVGPLGREHPRVMVLKYRRRPISVSSRLLAGRTLPTQAAGRFLFLPLLLDSHFSQAVQAAGYPGTQQLPALQALLALLAPKLWGKRRVSHVSDLCTDEGAGLFAGLNVLPKTTYATPYSYQTQRLMNERLVDELTRRVPLKEPPLGFNLDFHAIPFRGQKADLENHWVPKSHRGQPAVMAFVAQEAERRVMGYATANVVRAQADTLVCLAISFARK